MNESGTREVFKYSAFVIVIGLILYFFIQREEKEIELYKRYTVAFTKGYKYGAKKGNQVRFFYRVNGREFEGLVRVDSEVIGSNGRYLVEYSSKTPKLRHVLWNQPIPDSIRNIPASGWDTIPWK